MFKTLQTYADSLLFRHPNSVNTETRPYNRWTRAEAQALLCIFVEKENQHELESVKWKGVCSDLSKVGRAKHEPHSKNRCVRNSRTSSRITRTSKTTTTRVAPTISQADGMTSWMYSWDTGWPSQQQQQQQHEIWPLSFSTLYTAM